MKKRILAILLLLSLALTLCSCGKDEEPEPAETVAPAETQAVPGETLPPDEDGGDEGFVIDTTEWVGLVSDSFGVSLEYPSYWVNNPGKHTICYYDPATAEVYPTRFALTTKQLYHTPKAKVMPDHLKDYLKVLSEGYEKKSMEIGDLEEGITFMGHRAWATTYLAFKGKTEVKGYVIMTNIERDLYVFHYTAAYGTYEATSEDIMIPIRDSIHLTVPEKK